jgi:DNA phosphorothioation-dependent restriction protein DptG
MDKEYGEIIGLRNEIAKLREKKISLQTTLSVLEKERERYISELEKRGVPFDQIDRVIEQNRKKIEKISAKVAEIKQIFEKYLGSLNI